MHLGTSVFPFLVFPVKICGNQTAFIGLRGFASSCFLAWSSQQLSAKHIHAVRLSRSRMQHVSGQAHVIPLYHPLYHSIAMHSTIAYPTLAAACQITFNADYQTKLGTLPSTGIPKNSHCRQSLQLPLPSDAALAKKERERIDGA